MRTLPRHLSLYTWRTLSPEDVASVLGPAMTVAGEDGDGAAYRVTARDGTLLLDLEECAVDIDRDFARYLGAAVGRPAPRYSYTALNTSADGPGSQEHTALLVALAQALDGLVATEVDRLVWPAPAPGVGAYEPQDSEVVGDLSVLAWTWFVRHSVCGSPVRAWMRAVGEAAPRLLPTHAVGASRTMELDERGADRIESMVRNRWDGAALICPGPLRTVRMGAGPDRGGMYTVECAVPMGSQVVDELPVLTDLLGAVGDELGAELGVAEVVGGWGWDPDGVPGELAPGHGAATCAARLRVGDLAVAGLPADPVWQTYLGAQYADLVSAVMPTLPQGWRSVWTRRGRVVTVCEQPRAVPETDWFPPELCVGTRRRLLRAPVPRRARTLPCAVQE